MWKIIGYTNYECTEGPEQELGDFHSLNEAICAFIQMAEEPNTLDFSTLDNLLYEWRKSPDWDLDYYKGGYYGGSINLYEDARCLLRASFERDLDLNQTLVGEYDYEDNITEEEKRRFREVYFQVKGTHIAI